MQRKTAIRMIEIDTRIAPERVAADEWLVVRAAGDY
jgi:hypothetical protein